MLAAASAAGLDDVDTIAITNQRETTLLWDRATGRPVAPAIVWQDRRTAERCRELDAELIRERTGLVPDPYFSATKLEWLLREHARDGPRVRHRRQLARLEADRRRGARDRRDERLAHAARLARDARLGRRAARALRCRPRAAAAHRRSGRRVFGEGALLDRRVQIRGIAGDQQAALYGQGCHARRRGQGDLRHRQLRARAHGRRRARRRRTAC